MVKIGDKYYEMMPSWVRPKGSRFDYVIEIVGFKKESYGDFAVCKRVFPDGKIAYVSIAKEFFESDRFFVQKENETIEL